MAVLQYLKNNGGNISDATRVFGINRPVVCDILSKQATGDLRDRPRIPKRQPNKTRMGARWLSIHLANDEKIKVPAGSVRHILRRNRRQLRNWGSVPSIDVRNGS